MLVGVLPAQLSMLAAAGINVYALVALGLGLRRSATVSVWKRLAVVSHAIPPPAPHALS